MKLYELSDQLKELEQLVESGELTQDDVKDTMDALEGEWADKAVKVYQFIRNQEATITAIDEEIKRLGDKKRQLSGSNDYLKGYLVSNIAQHGEVNTDLLTLKLRKAPKVAVIDDESFIPEAYWSEVPATQKLDKRKLLAALKEFPVAGAHIEDGKQSLVVK